MLWVFCGHRQALPPPRQPVGRGYGSMADATIRKNRFGVYQVRVRLHGLQRERSLHTTSKREAEDRLGAIRVVLRHIADGVLDVPDEIDPFAFVLSGGKITAPTLIASNAPPHASAETLRSAGERYLASFPDNSKEAETLATDGKITAPTLIASNAPPHASAETLRSAGERYLASFPDNSKEAETLATEGTHLRHPYRLLGGQRRLADLTRFDLQSYVNLRVKEKGLRGTVQRKTIKMELDTFRQVWHWAVDEGIVAGSCPTLTSQQGRRSMAVHLPKGRQKERFRTWDEVQAILRKGCRRRGRRKYGRACFSRATKSLGSLAMSKSGPSTRGSIRWWAWQPSRGRGSAKSAAPESKTFNSRQVASRFAKRKSGRIGTHSERCR